MHVILKENATDADILEAAFHSELFLHVIDQFPKNEITENFADRVAVKVSDLERDLYSSFKYQSKRQGWRLNHTMIDTSECRMMISIDNEKSF